MSVVKLEDLDPNAVTFLPPSSLGPAGKKIGINSPVIQATGVLPWACNQVSEFSGKETAKLSLSLDDVGKERIHALDQHLQKAYNKYKSVLKANQWREVMKEDYVSAKQRHRDGMITTKVYDADGSPVTPDALQKGATVTVHLQPRYIYAVSGACGLTMDVLKVRVDQAGAESADFV